MRHTGEPVFSNAVYSRRSRFEHNFDEVCRQTSQWLFRRIFGATDTSHVPHHSALRGKTLEQIGCALRNPASTEPQVVLSWENSFQNRSNGLKALLSQMCVRHSAMDVCLSLSELMDLGRTMGMSNEFETFDHRLFMKRVSNLLFAYASHRVEREFLYDVESENRPGLIIDASSATQGTSRAASEDMIRISSPRRRCIVLTDTDSDSMDTDNDVEFISETRNAESSAASSRLPPCCSSHRRHCCCCSRKRSSITTATTAPFDAREEASSLFREFLEFYERRRKRRRVETVELNTPNDPIVISDDENQETQSTAPIAEPGPSTGHLEESSNFGDVPKQHQEREVEPAEIKNILESLHNRSPLLERPATAAEFYTLLNDAINSETTSVAGESSQQASTVSANDSINNNNPFSYQSSSIGASDINSTAIKPESDNSSTSEPNPHL